jgi:hypothetical protein
MCTLDDENVEKKANLADCKYQTQYHYFKGVNQNFREIEIMDKSSFAIILHHITQKMQDTLELNVSDILFSLKLANTLYMSESDYIDDLRSEFPDLDVFIDKFYNIYLGYIKCNHEHYIAKSGGINFPYLRMSYGGMPAGLSYLFIKTNDYLTPCHANRFFYYKEDCDKKIPSNGRGGTGEIDLLNAQ